MKVAFVLPGPGWRPVGGFKVIYEYANYLSNCSDQVEIFHATCVRDSSLPNVFRKLFKYLFFRLTGYYKPLRWFPLHKNVTSRLAWEIRPKRLSSFDAIVVSSWETAERFAQDSQEQNPCVFYLIQHHETWSGSVERVNATWKLPFKKIVISQWLRQLGLELGQEAKYIPNGMDQTKFGIDVPIETRNPKTVVMMFHEANWKGSTDGISALKDVRTAHSDLSVVIFGVYDRPKDLPRWIEYVQNPQQSKLREIYNRCAIFIGPSWAEGWPLPPAEAMLCGCCPVLTDIGGHQEYGEDLVTALIVPIKSPKAIASAVIKAIEDNQLRCSIARKASEKIRLFTWQKAGEQFRNYIDSEGSEKAIHLASGN